MNNESFKQIIVTPPKNRLTDYTVNAMRAAAVRASQDPEIRSFARRIVADVESRDYFTEAAALCNWVKENIRFTRDTFKLETLQTPAVTLSERAGDCDDMAALLAALAMSIGHKARFKVIGTNQPSHVYTEIYVDGRWVVFDPAEPPGITTPPPGYKNYITRNVAEVTTMQDINGNMRVKRARTGGKTTRINRRAQQTAIYQSFKDPLTALAKEIEAEVGFPVTIVIKKNKRPLGGSGMAVGDIIPIADLNPADVVRYKAVYGANNDYLVIPVGEESLQGLGDLAEVSGPELGGIWDSVKKFVQKAKTKIVSTAKKITKKAPKAATGLAKAVTGAAEAIAGGGLMSQLSSGAEAAGNFSDEVYEDWGTGAGGGGTTVVYGSGAGAAASEPFYKTPAGIAVIGIGGLIALKALKVIK